LNGTQSNKREEAKEERMVTDPSPNGKEKWKCMHTHTEYTYTL
jgi:hypothetical protein